MNQLPKKNVNIHEHEIINLIHSYLKKNVKINEFNSVHISSFDNLKTIKRNNYYIVPKYNGIYSWMIFIRLNGIYYAVTLNKYDKNLKLFPVDISVKEVIYEGSIFDGIFYKDKQTNKKQFIIHETYLLAGRSMLTLSRLDRMTVLNDYLNKKFQRNFNYNIDVCVNYFIEKESILKLYHLSKNDVTIGGWLFYPNSYNHNIYYYQLLNEDFDVKHNINKMFIMMKTKKPDVYHLFDLGDIERQNKIGIAHIPGIEDSKRCESWFNKNVNEVKVQCKRADNKWIPIQLMS
jgi:hypothetical protein